jgi:hypothetical protein
MKIYNFLINNRLIEVIAEDLGQAEKLAELINKQFEEQDRE